MKIVVAIQQRSFARFVAFDLADAARRLGWAVHWIDFDAHAQRLAGAPAEAWQATLEQITHEVRAFGPDVTFSYGLEAFGRTFERALPDSRWCLADAAAAPVACFFFDFGPPFDGPIDPRSAPWLGRLQQADVRVWCWDREALADLHRLGIAAEYLPMAVNERMFHPPAAGAPRDLPVVFSGGPTVERMATLRSIAPAGLSIYGYGAKTWQGDPVLAPCYRGFLPHRDDMRDAYQRARIAVNVTRAHGRASLNMRVFEAMACGCLLVTDQPDEAGRLFTPDEDLVTVGEGRTFADVVARWLADDEARTRVARRGCETVRTAHTYVARLQQIAPQLRAFVTESRAWPFWRQYLTADPAKALRFLEALRAERGLQREDLWHVAAARAHIALGRRDLARQAVAQARAANPALRDLETVADIVGAS